MRKLWAAAGFVSLGVGLVGVVLPLLPTVPFMLLAAFCFARSSERMHQWLRNHNTFGPPIRAWEERGAISMQGKVFATVSMAASVGVAIMIGLPPLAVGVQAAAILAITLFIWSRPVA